MKLKCTIGSHGFVGGHTYYEGDEYELEDEEHAKQIIKWGYAEEVKEVPSPASPPPLIARNEVPIEVSPLIEEESHKKTKAKRKY